MTEGEFSSFSAIINYIKAFKVFVFADMYSRFAYEFNSAKYSSLFFAQ